MKIELLSAYETNSADFFTTLKKVHASIVVDVRLHNSNQLCGFTKEGDLAYFIPTILGIPYIHDTRFAPSDSLLKSYIDHELPFERYAKGYRGEMADKGAKDLFKESYGSNPVVVLLGTATKKRRSHAEVLKSILEEN
jgi:hypothetical protein